MATAADAELVLKLYEMRREETLRRARRFMIFDFNPKTLEELSHVYGVSRERVVNCPVSHPAPSHIQLCGTGAHPSPALLIQHPRTARFQTARQLT